MRLGLIATLVLSLFVASVARADSRGTVVLQGGAIYTLHAAQPWGRALVIGADSDWPAPSMNPLDAIQVAVTRRLLDGGKPAFLPQERIGLAAVLAAYTRDAAWAAREEAFDGSTEVGKQADPIVLDRKLFEVDVTALHKVRVLLTLLDGEPVYRDLHVAWHWRRHFAACARSVTMV